MKNSGTFIRSIVPADVNNIVTLIDFNQILAPYQEFTIDNIVEHAIILEDFQVKIGLFSLLEADWPNINALASESAQAAELSRIKKEGQKIYLGIYHAYGNGPWIKKGEEILQNKNSLEQPWALMAPFFSTNETAILDEDLKIGVKIEPKAQGNGGLKGSDYLHIFGSWRKVTNIRKKKDNGIEVLSARIEALELALDGKLTNLPPNSLLGKTTTAGTVEVIPDNFLSSKDETITGQKTFSKILTSLKEIVSNGVGILSSYSQTTAARLFSTGGGAYLNLSNAAAPVNSKLIDLELNFQGLLTLRKINDAYNALVANIFQVDESANFKLFGFTTLGDNVPLKVKRLTGITAGVQGGIITIFHGISGGGNKIVGYLPVIYHDGIGGSVLSDFDTYSGGYAYDCWHSNTEFYIQNASGNSAHILSKQFSILIFYTN